MPEQPNCALLVYDCGSQNGCDDCLDGMSCDCSCDFCKITENTTNWKWNTDCGCGLNTACPTDCPNDDSYYYCYENELDNPVYPGPGCGLIIGCTDPTALNYNPDASIDCENCCEYSGGGDDPDCENESVIYASIDNKWTFTMNGPSPTDVPMINTYIINNCTPYNCPELHNPPTTYYPSITDTHKIYYVNVKLNGNFSQNSDDKLFAIINGEIRGVTYLNKSICTYTDEPTDCYFYLKVSWKGGNASAENNPTETESQIYFYYYNSSNQEIYIVQSIFNPEGNYYGQFDVVC
tara:strand:- start:1446 stop:2324 length:879 start_codon:yes stop_codon:yes gene_type:complete